MANPKKRHTGSRRDSRRAHWKRLALPGLSKCQQCGTQRLPHRVCPGCGFYKGQLVVEVAQKKGKGEEPK
jgi:large subunit ribosomal protein L32